MANRETFVTNAAESTLSSSLAAGATTINVTSTTAFPAVPFYVVIDPDVDASREVILVDSGKTATTFTLTAASSRGQDGTTDTAHSSGAKVACVPVAALWTDINDRVDAAGDDLTAHLADVADAHDASAISYVGGTGMSATDVEAAIDELATEKANASDLTAHIDDATAAHAASAISYVGGTGMSATDVEAAIDELATEKANASDLTAHIDDAADAHDASAISVVDRDDYFDGTDVEAVLAELGLKLTPVGSVTAFAGSSAPTGWLLCDGSAVSRTTYADLFAVVGTTFGAGDGSTTFNLPDLRGRAPIGVGTGSGLTARTLGQQVGAETHTLTAGEMPAHTHDILVGYGGSAVNAARVSGNDTGGTGVTSDTWTNPVQSKGGDGAHNNMQPSLALNFIIRAS